MSQRRITIAEVDESFETLCKRLGVPVGHYERREVYGVEAWAAIPGGWSLSNSHDPRAPGLVIEIMADDGTTSVSRPFGMERKSKRKMFEFIRAVHEGITLERNRTNEWREQ